MNDCCSGCSVFFLRFLSSLRDCRRVDRNVKVNLSFEEEWLRASVDITGSLLSFIQWILRQKHETRRFPIELSVKVNNFVNSFEQVWLNSTESATEFHSVNIESEIILIGYNMLDTLFRDQILKKATH